MRILVDSLYLGNIWTAEPSIMRDGELVTSIKFKLIKMDYRVSRLFQIGENLDGNSQGKLVARELGFENVYYPLQPEFSLSNRKSIEFVHPNYLKRLREDIPEIEFPMYIDQSDATFIGECTCCYYEGGGTSPMINEDERVKLRERLIDDVSRVLNQDY